MNSLLEGTSRLAQMAFLLAVGAVFVLICSTFITGSGKLAPLLFVVAGGMALWAFMREREDFGMWPAYATFGIALVGLIASVPLLLNTRGHADIALRGNQARSNFSSQRNALDAAFPVCTHDGPAGNCTAASIASTRLAQAAGITAQGNCTRAHQTCISDSGAGYLVQFVTPSIPPVGRLRLEESRTLQNKVISTTCRALDAGANAADVRAACGPNVSVAVG